MEEVVDQVVIGAGWFGLAAAKTYIELHPHENVLVVEAASTLGGTWAKDRLYPGLKSNNMLGTYEYSDFPMDTATYGVKPTEFIPGTVVYQYLTKYAQQFGVYNRIRFNTKVEAAEHLSDGRWLLTLTKTSVDEKFPQEFKIQTKRLIVASGLTSDAFIPEFEGRETFHRPIIHSKDFALHADKIKSAQTVTVIGGSKSATDTAYECAAAGVPVDIVIRESGNGPCWLSPPFVTPLKKWLEKLVHTRFLTWFSPCVWGKEDGYCGIRWFLHATAIGRWIVDGLWSIITNDVTTLTQYDKDPEMKKLKPWHSVFWTASCLGILNYPTEFSDLVRTGSIHIHISDISHLSEKKIHLKSGKTLDSDAIVCATGWKPSPPMKFLPAEISANLGLPYSSEVPHDVIEKADMEILKQFPRLKRQPRFKIEQDPGKPRRPFFLYRFMVPPHMIHERSIAFAGMLATITSPIVASIQALWICAYMDGKLDRMPDGSDDALWEATLHAEYCKWRHPCAQGLYNPEFAFDVVPYFDMLLKDLKLKSHRKPSLLADIFDPYGPEDYKGLVDEWRRGH